MTSQYIKIRNLTKEFYTIKRKVIALKDINLEIKGGEFFVILGPSGCGKSTMLNILAGLERPTKGEVWFRDRIVASKEKKIFLTPKERNVSMVFQSYALYPHMSVFENISFPLKIQRLSVRTIKKKVVEMAKMLDIYELLSSKPAELSGGQRQRVAIARALVRWPDVFLLDEPLSNLDAQLRMRMREELKNLQRRLSVTTVYVTHDQVEAMTFGDKIAILENGELQQVGDPLKVYSKPVNTFVASFLGTPPMNFLEGKIIEVSNKISINVGSIKINLNNRQSRAINKLKCKNVIIGIRPEDIRIAKEDNLETFQRKVDFIERLGSDTLLYFKIDENILVIKLKEDRGISEGEIIRISIPPKKIHLFNKNGINIKTSYKDWDALN